MCAGARPPKAAAGKLLPAADRGVCVCLCGRKGFPGIYFFPLENRAGAVPGAEGSRGLAALATELVEERRRRCSPQPARGLCQRALFQPPAPPNTNLQKCFQPQPLPRLLQPETARPRGTPPALPIPASPLPSRRPPWISCWEFGSVSGCLGPLLIRSWLLAALPRCWSSVQGSISSARAAKGSQPQGCAFFGDCRGNKDA